MTGPPSSGPAAGQGSQAIRRCARHGNGTAQAARRAVPGPGPSVLLGLTLHASRGDPSLPARGARTRGAGLRAPSALPARTPRRPSATKTTRNLPSQQQGHHLTSSCPRLPRASSRHLASLPPSPHLAPARAGTVHACELTRAHTPLARFSIISFLSATVPRRVVSEPGAPGAATAARGRSAPGWPRSSHRLGAHVVHGLGEQRPAPHRRGASAPPPPPPHLHYSRYCTALLRLLSIITSSHVRVLKFLLLSDGAGACTPARGRRVAARPEDGYSWDPVTAAARRGLVGPGSRCGGCHPCRPVHVAIQPGRSFVLEYYPEAWRCNVAMAGGGCAALACKYWWRDEARRFARETTRGLLDGGFDSIS
ncbi:hypothetical protein HU200_023934 [Digitaria exilis]|uniref:Epidermal patterning factor-like protein n=1 Tax=Digitaria exilis TaxID=1010633 RepID=A0A835C428_9POAL|nr:hypothetical protein HU200_023934 [Digitaria exilis]